MIFHQTHNSLANYRYNAFFYTDKIWESHFHRNFELIYVDKGAVHCTVGTRPYRLTKGDFGLCMPYDVHRYQPEEDTRYWVLVFSEDHIRYLSKQLSGKTGDSFCFRCKPAVERFVREQLINNNALTTLTLKGCLYILFEEYLGSVRLVERSVKEVQLADRIADYVRRNHTRSLTLFDLAAELGYDYNYMSRCFRRIFDMSFSDFVNIYRLETATALLEESDDGMTDIAFKSGFQSVRTFNDVFRKNTGMTPSQYQQAVKK